MPFVKRFSLQLNLPLSDYFCIYSWIVLPYLCFPQMFLMFTKMSLIFLSLLPSNFIDWYFSLRYQLLLTYFLHCCLQTRQNSLAIVYVPGYESRKGQCNKTWTTQSIALKWQRNNQGCLGSSQQIQKEGHIQMIKAFPFLRCMQCMQHMFKRRWDSGCLVVLAIFRYSPMQTP